jgi:geranylgeranyl pyrophosphate synthase
MKNKFEKTLASIYPNQSMQEILDYNLLAGGKRLRPMLLINMFQDLNAQNKYSLDDCMIIASSIEMIHTYSLIHDDLPGMDNDDLRRGKPTTHIKFSHADAILAGDALLTDAFTQLTQTTTIEADKIIKIIQLISEASGSQGMILGQKLDIDNKIQTVEQINRMHELKTGRLIMLPAQICDVLFASQTSDKLIGLTFKLGQWFQLNDDIIDQVASTDELGKPSNSDTKNQKINYISLIGLDESIRTANNMKEKIIRELEEMKLINTQKFILEFLDKNKLY